MEVICGIHPTIKPSVPGTIALKQSMKDLIVVTTPADDTQATLTVTKLTKANDDLFINAYPFQIPSNPIRPGQQVKAKHYPDPDFKLTTVYKGQVISIDHGKRIVKIHIHLNKPQEQPITTELKGIYSWIQGVFGSRGS